MSADDDEQARLRDRGIARAAGKADPRLIEGAKQIALDIAFQFGTVTSTKVLDTLKDDPDLRHLLDGVDPRFMGAVFRKGWERVGFDNSGSHKRPVTVWKRREETRE